MGDMTDVDRTLRRIAVRSTITGCTSCGLREVATNPIPFRGPSPTKIAVVGEAPGKVEDAVGEPFRGPSGELLEGVLTELLFSLNDIAYLNAVSCYPDRTPTGAEVVACSENLTAQLDVLDCRYVLALGGVAVNALRGNVPTVRLGEIRGTFWHAQVDGLDIRPLVMATWHPSAVLRNGQLREQMEADIAYFGLVADQDLTEDIQGLYCVKCGSPEVAYEQELPYCQKHLKRGSKR